ncbi:MAG: zinc ribbon domain-containing protein [Bifidobacteriaceae bacterium]|jgi:hypothetical protein|nr:zinc ribbon domain-containing protein [Bifidobacteriaceae bacterium]
MNHCVNCGAALVEGSRYCVSCGADSATAAPPASPEPARLVRRPAPEPILDSRRDVVSTGGYIGTVILLSLPLIGMISAIIWAWSGRTNLNRRNLARASLILALVGLVLGILLAVLFAVVWESFWEQLGEQTGGELGNLGDVIGQLEGLDGQ